MKNQSENIEKHFTYFTLKSHSLDNQRILALSIVREIHHIGIIVQNLIFKTYEN